MSKETITKLRGAIENLEATINKCKKNGVASQEILSLIKISEPLLAQSKALLRQCSGTYYITDKKTKKYVVANV